MRDVVVHGYFGVKPQRVWKTIKEDLILLKERMIEIMSRIKPANG